MLPDSVHHLYGFLSAAEANLLYDLASTVPKDGVIVEIGNFQGKSTVCLGLGAKQAGAWVWSIDPHGECWVNNMTHYGMENHAALLMNLVLNDVADTVRVIALSSEQVAEIWDKPINLLWVDGSHDYLDVYYDLVKWMPTLSPTGRIVVHDSNGHYPGVTRALTEFLMNHEWKISQQVDATAVLERA